MMFRNLGRSAAPVAALALAALVGPARAATPADPTGTYLTEDGRARIRLEKCVGDKLCGFVVWLKTPLNEKNEPRIDFRNPDPKKQARPSLGHQLILGLKPNKDAHYEGKIYDSEGGKFYDVTVWTEAPNELTVRGCLVAFLCKSQTWNKVTDVLPGQLAGPTNGPNGPRLDAEYVTAKPAAVKAGAKPAANAPAADE